MSAKKANRKTEVDLEGRVRRLSFSAKTHVCRPLFEALHNALDSIAEGKCTEGLIKVVINRDSPQLKLELDEKPGPVKNLTVIDNGRGFDEENMQSFATLDSQHKLQKGGKGIGRLSWLKAFEKVEVESVFEDVDGFKKRRFVFSTKGLTDEEVSTSSQNETGAAIKLINYKPLYESYFGSKKLLTIANEIARDFLPYLLFGKPCTIQLIDGAENESIKREDLPLDQKTEFELEGNKFEVHHVRILSGEDAHRLFYCASGRSVLEEKLHDIGVPVGKRGKLKKEEDRDDFWYRAYVTSPYLDEHVNSDRTDFNIEPEPLELTNMLQMVAMSQIRENVKKAIEEYLQKPIEALAAQKEQRVKEAFEEDLAPYSYIFENNRAEIDKLPIDAPKEEIVKKVMQVHAEKHISARQEASRVLDSLKKALTKTESFESLHKKMNEWLELHQADLAQYVLYRAWILELLSTLIAKQPDGGYFKEADIHELICPMRLDSWNQVKDEDGHNLWILDDRFSFFDYLASDIQLSQYKPKKKENTKKSTDKKTSKEKEGRERPDICTYYFANSKADEKATSIVIVEFKRPGRTNLKDQNNKSPVEQVLSYIKKIKDGKVRDFEGHEIHTGDDTNFFCYIVCDTETEQMKDFAQLYRLKPSFEGGGYYVHYDNPKAYIEILSLKKLLVTARKRHKKLFSKLKLPAKLVDFDPAQFTVSKGEAKKQKIEE